MKLIPIYLSVALAGTALGAGDFFGTPEKTIVPKPTATPAPATPAPDAVKPAGAEPVLTPDDTDPLFLKTPTVGGEKGLGAPFRDLGPDYGVLIGFEYSTSVNDAGETVIQSLQPIYVRAAGKTRGTLHGKVKPGNPATMLEARPGFAVAAVDAKGGTNLEGFKVTFMKYESGKLDPRERYTSKWCGGDGGDKPARHLATDTRPVYGVFGHGGPDVNELGLLVRKEPPVIKDTPFVMTPQTGDEAPSTGADKLTGGGPLETASFDTAYLQTPSLAGTKRGWGSQGHDLAPMSATLVGFDFTTGTSEGGDADIKSIQPIYVLANGSRKLGSLLGTAGDAKPVRAAAREGYAVAALDGRGTGTLSGFQITYARVKGGALDTSDLYQSEWYGASDGQFTRASGEGRLIAGIAGKFGKDVNALALLVKKDAPGTIATVKPATPAPVPGATPAPAVPHAPGECEIFAVADDEFTLFLNGREILSGNNYKHVEETTAPVVKGDVFAALVKDKGTGSNNEAWLSLRIVRDGKTIFDAGDMHYMPTETLNWKTSKLLTGFKDPKVWTHEILMGTDKRPRAAWANPKDTTATTLYFKGVVP